MVVHEHLELDFYLPFILGTSILVSVCVRADNEDLDKEILFVRLTLYCVIVRDNEYLEKKYFTL